MIGGKFVLDCAEAYNKLNKAAYSKQKTLDEKITAGYNSINSKAYQSRNNVEEKLA